jgi:hypothetical protein
MFKYIALYQRPSDPESFDEKYFGSHLPLVEHTPGLVRQEVAKVSRVFVPGFLGTTEPPGGLTAAARRVNSYAPDPCCSPCSN